MKTLNKDIIPEVTTGAKIAIPTKTIQERITLQTRVQGVIGLFLEKLSRIYANTHFPDSKTTTFQKVDGNTYVFQVGAHMKFGFPAEFIIETDTITSNSFDFLIQDWKFFINTAEIPLGYWTENDIIGLILSGARDKAARIANIPPPPTSKDEEEALEKKEKRTERQVRSIQARFRKAMASLDRKLLPERVSNEGEVTQKGIPLLPALGKLPSITVAPRN